MDIFKNKDLLEILRETELMDECMKKGQEFEAKIHKQAMENLVDDYIKKGENK